MDPAQLLAPATAAVWRAAEQLPAGAGPEAVARLRAAAPAVAPELVSAILTQVELRRRAQLTFGESARTMLFTSDGLQQATRPYVAARRAQSLADSLSHSPTGSPAGAATGAPPRVVDAGCGLGIDSIAMRAAGLDVIPLELDPGTAAIAQHNIGTPVGIADIMSGRLPAASAVFLDPARRSNGSRINDPRKWHPPWPWILELAASRAVVAKAAPGLPHEQIPPAAAAEWISADGSLVETTVWFPPLAAGRPRRRAVVLERSPDPWRTGSSLTLSSDRPPEPAPVHAVGEYLIEPDAAVIRSHLIDVLADRIGAGVLSPGIAYLTSNGPPPPGWGQTLRIVDRVPAGARRLRRRLVELGVGRVEIHTRGLGLDPAEMRRALRLSGRGPVQHVVLTRENGSAAGFLVDLLPRTGDDDALQPQCTDPR